jgi:hypothetical protein
MGLADTSTAQQETEATRVECMFEFGERQLSVSVRERFTRNIADEDLGSPGSVVTWEL